MESSNQLIDSRANNENRYLEASQAPQTHQSLQVPYISKPSINKQKEYQLRLETFIQKSQESNFIKLQIKNIEDENIAKIYNKRAGSSGLQNLGNSCYLNAVLQCLRHTMILNHYLFGSKLCGVLLRNQASASIENEKIALLINYMKISSTLWDHDDGILTPMSLKSIFGFIYEQFNGNDQHDAHECLVTLLNCFHDTLSRNVKYKITGEVINDLDKHIKQAHEDWEKHYKKRHSAILDIFSGQLQIKTICSNCQKISSVYDPIMVLDLPLPNNISHIAPVSYTLSECLNNYVQPEQLTLDNLYKCEHCKQQSQAYRINSIWTLPNVLIIKLSRFHFSFINQTYRMNKITDFIHYPIHDLDVSKYVSSPLNEQTKYDLYGVICHEGCANIGHYYSYCFNSLKGKWFVYNDHNVNEVEDINTIITSSAYILFYQKNNII